MSGTSGPISRPPLASYDPDSFSWRTSQDTLAWGSETFSETWPASGMTRNGSLYRLLAWGPAIAANESWGQSAAQQAASGRALRELAGCGGAPLALLPTPTAAFMDPPDMDGWEARRIATKARVGNSNGFGTPLGVAVRLLPMPRATDGDKGGPSQRGSKGDLTMPSVVHLSPDRWGEYAGAIARHEHMLGRPAPEPTEPTGRGGAHRLSPRFVEWMMAIPDGWVTDVPDLLRNQQLRALGNGVVPIQAATALRHMLSVPADWESTA